jgi:CheY-like chemotaxis protein/glycine cleavage system H lipoate-binding protein
MSDKASILVVDDEEIVCVSVRKILTREGYEVDMAMSAAEALDKIGQGGYKLVITDLMMPEKNGIEMMHSIKKRGIEVPFVMITGYPTIKTGVQALRLGAIDYIPKPFTRQELLGPVNRALRRGGSPQPVGPALQIRSPSEPVLPGDRFVLPEHSWAVYDQEGTFAVGIEDSFLKTAGAVESIEAPEADEMVEQGYPTIRLTTEDGGEHSVFMPFSGRVVAVNHEALKDPGKVTASDWILQIIPSNLDAEVEVLIRKK